MRSTNEGSAGNLNIEMETLPKSAIPENYGQTVPWSNYCQICTTDNRRTVYLYQFAFPDTM